MKNITKKLDLAPWPCTLIVTMVDELEDCSGRTCADGDGNIYIEYEKSSFPDLVVHESTHAKQFLEKYVSTTLDSETEAYLLQHIVNWTLNTFVDYIGGTDNKKGNK